MQPLFRLLSIWILCLVSLGAAAQQPSKGKVVDAITGEPLHGVSIHCLDEGCTCSCLSNASGDFEIKMKGCQKISISCTGYQDRIFTTALLPAVITLTPSVSQLNEVVVTASRGENMRRSQAPMAITSLSQRTIQETKAISADQLLNKVSGVNMVNLGNEQHQMSIRQPMTTKSLFLYLEDGIPVRTTGLFNHNALLEMNLSAVKQIEVIKGSSSALYGSEAIGGMVNFITLSPTIKPVFKLSAQANNGGYRRGDFQSSFSKNRWGFVISGYYADKRNGFMEYSDFHKGTVTARVDYRIHERTSISNAATWMTYYSDMPGGVDSAMFASRTFINPQTFTYRKVDAFRYRSTLTQQWNSNDKTTVSLVYRNNAIGQNPNYRIKDDYRKTGNTWVGRKDLAHGEINRSSFRSYNLLVQHTKKMNRGNITAGASMDVSPSSYNARYIRITKDSVTKKYTGFLSTDSSLTRYTTGISNYAGFANAELDLTDKIKITGSLRYDLFVYRFDNALRPSAFSGSADTVNRFQRISPKIGFTYQLAQNASLYANYSQGFVPPQVTEMYTGVKVPSLQPAVFYNYEAGAWAELIKNKMSIDASIYWMQGTNEIISVKLDDGSSENRNAGETSHKGIEYGIQATPVRGIRLRFGGAYSQHHFTSFVEKGVNYSGNEMNGAPRWLHNAELTYRPAFIKGLRIGMEWQGVGAYYTDPKNTTRYSGYNIFHLRTGYAFKGWEIWMHVMNATDRYYATVASRSATAQSFQLGEPRSFSAGISFNLATLNN